MSFDVTVYGRKAGHGELRELYEVPLGGHGTVVEYWVGPALALGLPILARLERGELTVAHEELAAFAQELDVLAGHWADVVPGRRRSTSLLTALLHRLALVRAAVRMAEVTGGHLYV
ncbi:hypothetical protein AB0L25_32800 [Spirillospora sp. NPDC052242]